jgi:hypothetical protein
MRSAVAHWGTREWRKNQDDLVHDPAHPQAFPSVYPMDLMGRIRVKLTVEDGDLVAYGFGGQRIVMPRRSVGAVLTASKFRLGSITHARALLVLDREERVLLRADGLWETYGEVARVCRVAKLGEPKHLYLGSSASRKYQAKRGRSALQPPRFNQAPGYAKLRVYPRGRLLRILALIVLFGLTMGLGGFLGTLPAVALPEWFGAVRTLFGIIGALLGIAAGVWVGAAIWHLWVDAVRWAGASLAAGGLAPAGRFFGRRREHAGTWLAMANLGLFALLVALIGWGPGVGIVSLTHGFRDSSLVASLRADGVTTQGLLVDVPDYGTDDHGNETVQDVSTLDFKAGGDLVEATDPSIGGRPLPLNAADPLGTNMPETVVYLPDDPSVAATQQQITGSVWHGAPAANLISGGLLTLALPPYVFFLVLRIRRLRFLRAKGLVEDLTS